MSKAINTVTRDLLLDFASSLEMPPRDQMVEEEDDYVAGLAEDEERMFDDDNVENENIDDNNSHVSSL